jgi:hypothetical protein
VNSIYKGCDRSQPTKAVTGHRTPKSYTALRIRSQLAKWPTAYILDRNAFNLGGQFFAGFLAVKMNSKNKVAGIILLDADTRHARFTEQACRMPLFYFTYFLFGSYGLPPLTPRIQSVNLTFSACKTALMWLAIV